MAKKHWIYIKRGLSEDPKHRTQMGECIWLYMHIIDRADWETGIAFDWKDGQEAAEMGMSVDTLRRQRQKLEEFDYIRCFQKQHGQDVKIMEWRNPRDYGSEVKNPRFEGSHETPPSDFQGLNQGSNEGLNQGTRQVKTPTLPSKSKSSKGSEGEARPNFQSMSIGEAREYPTIKLYREAAEFFPGSPAWEYVDRVVTQYNLTFEQIHKAAEAWAIHGYKPQNIKGVLEWAINGVPGSNLNKISEPKSFDGIRKFLEKANVESN